MTNGPLLGVIFAVGYSIGLIVGILIKDYIVEIVDSWRLKDDQQ